MGQIAKLSEQLATQNVSHSQSSVEIEPAIQSAVASDLVPQTPPNNQPAAETPTRSRSLSSTTAASIFRVIGGAIKGTPTRNSDEDLQAQIEALQVQKNTLVQMNRKREQEVLDM